MLINYKICHFYGLTIDYYIFVFQSILSAIHPLSPTQAIPKLLATQDKNDTMKVRR